MDDGYKKDVRERLLDRAAFVKATFSDPSPRSNHAWKKVVVRPVLIRERPVLQFSYFDATRDISKNYDDRQAPAMVDQLLGLGFRQIAVETTQATLRIARAAGGKARVDETRRDQTSAPPDVRHNRRKQVALPVDRPDRFLQAIGVATAEGAIKAGQQDKHRQINDFLKLVRESLDRQALDRSALSLVDCGCGAAYLTFAAYHYLSDLVDIPVKMVGVDVRDDLIARRDDVARSLGWDGLSFNSSSIADYHPSLPPDIVLALHACDTATDDALAGGIRWNSAYIFSAPCCHHYLQAQLDAAGAPALFAPIYRHGILAERMGDILTDALRALILRIMGYKTDVAQFVSGEHTARNVMIRAVRADLPAVVRGVAAREYRDLTSFWGVTPYLATLLGDTFQAAMASYLREE